MMTNNLLVRYVYVNTKQENNCLNYHVNISTTNNASLHGATIIYGVLFVIVIFLKPMAMIKLSLNLLILYQLISSPHYQRTHR
mmetsp:Transcript_18846/g.18136  ORF Transcript_18846/g.18136 Transcript_18846/m.18136 type:complete len:83 (-) Transcript_18846:95-343(-)